MMMSSWESGQFNVRFYLTVYATIAASNSLFRYRGTIFEREKNGGK